MNTFSAIDADSSFMDASDLIRNFQPDSFMDTDKRLEVSSRKAEVTIETAGNGTHDIVSGVEIQTGGNLSQDGGSGVEIQTEGNFSQDGGSGVEVQTGGNFSQDGGSEMELQTDGNVTQYVRAEIEVPPEGNVTQYVGAEIEVTPEGNVTQSVGAEMEVENGRNLNVSIEWSANQPQNQEASENSSSSEELSDSDLEIRSIKSTRSKRPDIETCILCKKEVHKMRDHLSNKQKLEKEAPIRKFLMTYYSTQKTV